MKRLILILSCAVIFATFSLTTFADSSSGALITVVIPQVEKQQSNSVPTRPIRYLYPSSVLENKDGTRREIIKTYELSEKEKPEHISRESFTRDGYLYELSDVTKNESASADSQEHTEKVLVNSATKDTDAILKLLEPEIEYTSEDGYIGILQLDISGIKVETAGYRNNSYPVQSTRKYTSLSSNDTSYIPKTITENGRTLTLTNVDWKAQNSVNVDYVQIPNSYTAIATYSGTATSTSVTEYTVTAKYNGIISKIITGKTVYAAHFIGVPIVTPGIARVETKKQSAENLSENTLSDNEIILGEEILGEVNSASEPLNSSGENVKEDKHSYLPLILLNVVILLCIAGLAAYFVLRKNKKGNQTI